MTISNNWQALAFLTVYVGLFALVHYAREAQLRRRWKRACRLRALRLHNLVNNQPFHPQLVPEPERQKVRNRLGLTSDQWYEAAKADHVPLCGEYRREFGTAVARFYYGRRGRVRY